MESYLLQPGAAIGPALNQSAEFGFIPAATSCKVSKAGDLFILPELTLRLSHHTPSMLLAWGTRASNLLSRSWRRGLGDGDGESERERGRERKRGEGGVHEEPSLLHVITSPSSIHWLSPIFPSSPLIYFNARSCAPNSNSLSLIPLPSQPYMKPIRLGGLHAPSLPGIVTNSPFGKRRDPEPVKYAGRAVDDERAADWLPLIGCYGDRGPSPSAPFPDLLTSAHA